MPDPTEDRQGRSDRRSGRGMREAQRWSAGPEAVERAEADEHSPLLLKAQRTLQIHPIDKLKPGGGQGRLAADT